MDRERVDAGLEFVRQRRVHHAVALDAALAGKRFRHDRDPEMGLATRPVTGVAGVLMGFIDHVEARGGEGRR